MFMDTGNPQDTSDRGIYAVLLQRFGIHVQLMVGMSSTEQRYSTNKLHQNIFGDLDLEDLYLVLSLDS